VSLIKVNWEGNMNFKGLDSDGREISMDAAEGYGGLNKGSRPMDVMLMALGGCTAIEVGHVLNKMRVPYADIKVEVTGERAETIPKVFTKIKVNYLIKGDSIPRVKVEKAIRLGESYCSAANMIKQSCPIEYEYELNGVSYKLDADA